MSTKISRRLSNIKKRARLKNIKLDIDYNWMRSKCNQKNCEISNLPFDNNKGVWYTQSIDRVDNSGGYTKDNCKVVLWGMNVGKGSNSYKNLYDVAKAFVEQFEKDTR